MLPGCNYCPRPCHRGCKSIKAAVFLVHRWKISKQCLARTCFELWTPYSTLSPATAAESTCEFPIPRLGCVTTINNICRLLPAETHTSEVANRYLTYQTPGYPPARPGNFTTNSRSLWMALVLILFNYALKEIWRDTATRRISTPYYTL